MTRLVVRDGVRAAADLHTLTAVGGASGVLKAHIALAADSHTEGAVAEHLDADGVAVGTKDVSLRNLRVDVSHLVHVKLTRKHHHVGKLSVELQCLGVADIELCGEMHLHTLLPAVCHHSHVGSDDSRNLRLIGSVDDVVHKLHVLVIDDGVDGKITLHAVLGARGSYLTKVVDGEMIG